MAYLKVMVLNTVFEVPKLEISHASYCSNQQSEKFFEFFSSILGGNYARYILQ